MTIFRFLAAKECTRWKVVLDLDGIVNVSGIIMKVYNLVVLMQWAKLICYMVSVIVAALNDYGIVRLIDEGVV